MNYTYKVGGKPRVKNKEKLEETEWMITRGMREFAGGIVTIKSVDKDLPRQPYRIVEDGGMYAWSEDLFEPLTLKEQYFRTGYVVEMRNGEKYIILRDGNEADLIDFSSDGNSHADWESFDEYDDNLNFVGDWGDEEYDIVKVYDRISRWGEPLSNPIWQLEEVKETKEMTMEEIETLVGTKVKIVGQ